MKRLLIVGLVGVLAGTGVMVGCEEKSDTGGTVDKMKNAGSAAVDKAKDMGNKVKDEVQNLMDTTKAKIDALSKGGDSLKPDQKAEFDKAMTSIHAGWDDLSAKFKSATSSSADAMAKGLADAKDAGQKLLDNVKATAEKFGIKLN